MIGGPTVLLVDDDPVQLKLTSRLLADGGYQVATVTGVIQAFEAARQRRPDVVVSDVLLGDLDGFTLCRMMRGEPTLADVPIVLVSAHFGNEEDRRLATAVGASAFAERTPEFESEIQAVARVLGEGVRPLDREIEPSVPDLYARRVTAQLHQLLGKAQSAEARYRALFDHAGDALAVLDESGRVEEVNRRWEEILSRPRNEIVGRLLAELAAPGHPDLHFEGQRHRDTGPGQGLVWVRRPDGGIRYLDLSSTRVETDTKAVLFVVGRDITASLEGARKLEASQARYRSLVDNIPDLVRTVDVTGKILFVGSKAEAICGVTAHELTAAPASFWLDRIHPEDLGRVRAAYQGLVSRREALDLEYRWQHGTGWRWFHERAILTEREGVPCVDSLLSDVTARRSLEEQMRQAQKMEAIGQLTGGVAHDFNNILAAILANSHFLIESLSEQDPRRADAEEIKVCAERAASLTRQLLAFSRRQVLEPRILDLNEVVNGLERMLRRLIGANIQFSVSAAADLAPVRADPGQVEQVIANLVVNARDAMPDGGVLSIETANVDLDAEYAARHVGARPGPHVLLAITDSGCGMDAETRRRAFEPFFTTKERGKGTGLGLSTCYGIVKQSGGSIWIYSELGHGTSFKVYLPVAAAVLSKVPRRAAAVNLRGSETVLVIEDDDSVRAAVARILTGYGYHVLLAHDGKGALEVYRSHQGPIHLALSDVIMPGPSGPEVLRDITDRSSATRTLLMSGYTEHALLRDGGPAAGTSFIAKPFTPEALARKVRQLLDATD
jgi:two-component system cell cycle sensor histidine kinase/response regulator CckA